jgi:hypothetical protein
VPKATFQFICLKTFSTCFSSLAPQPFDTSIDPLQLACSPENKLSGAIKIRQCNMIFNKAISFQKAIDQFCCGHRWLILLQGHSPP